VLLFVLEGWNCCGSLAMRSVSSWIGQVLEDGHLRKDAWGCTLMIGGGCLGMQACQSNEKIVSL